MNKYKTFNVLAFFMIGFGMLIGVFFPFFVLIAIDVDFKTVITPLFFVMTITAGIIVGFFNIYLAKTIVGAKLKVLGKHMTKVEGKLLDKTNKDAVADCFSADCFIEVYANDEIGECANSFNSLVGALHKAFSAEEAVRNFSEMLSSKLELDTLASEALKNLLDNMEADAGAIVIEKEGELKLLSSSGISKAHNLIDNEAIWNVFKDKKKLV